MEDWLQKLRTHPRLARLGLLFLFLIILFAILNQVAMMSDIGFSDEIKKYRWWILLVAGVIGLIVVFVYDYRQIRGDRDRLRLQVEGLTHERDDLTQQKDSLLRLMEAYKADAQEDIFNRLKQLATLSIKQREWREKGARVERFRIEELTEEPAINGEVNAIERITVMINLGNQDNVMEGMQFIIQDPTDSQKYGLIVVRECHANGSACAVIEMNHPAFWDDVRQTLESTKRRAGIIVAQANVIIPHNPFREINPDTARQLLDWIQNLEEVEL